jgi:hypothetical protein
MDQRNLSILLDQAQRQLMMLVTPDRLGELASVYDIDAATDLMTARDSNFHTQTISAFKIKGDGGLFWDDPSTGGGDASNGREYDDEDIIDLPSQTMHHELYKILEVSFTPSYFRTLNAIADPDPPDDGTSAGVVMKADEVHWRRIVEYDDPYRGQPLNSDRFYDRAQLTVDATNGQNVLGTGTLYNVERTVPHLYAIQGNTLYTYPVVDQDADILLSVWGLFFPERFLTGTGKLKKVWKNDSGVCEMPAEFWPAIVTWAAAKAKAILTEEGRTIAMRQVLQELNMGEAVQEEDEQARYSDARG